MNTLQPFRLAEYAKSFATRSKGHELFQQLVKLVGVNERDSVIVDWLGVSAASTSFIDEFVGQCCETFMSTNKTIFILNDPHMIKMISIILKRRYCQVFCASQPMDILENRLTVLGTPAKTPVATA